MDIKLTEEQTQLQDIAVKFMDKHCDFEFVRKMEKDSELGFCRDMWRQFSEMGWLGIMVPEKFDGMGMNLAPVCEYRIGRDHCGGMDKAGLWRFRLPLLNQEARSPREKQVGIVSGDPCLPCTILSTRI